MEASQSAGKRGRPRDPERMRKVLEAAQEQFRLHGYERTSMEGVAHASGVSKVTIYRYFPSKEALFEAAVSLRTDAAFGVERLDSADPLAPRRVLMQVAEGFLQLIRAEDVVCHQRMMIAAATTNPEACQAFYRQGPEKVVSHLATYLQACARAGSLLIEDPLQAADQFLSLYLGSGHCRLMLGLPGPSAGDDARLLQANVDFFLRAYGAPKGEQ
ncbi:MULTISPECIES: TetR/AcrR family transcriptional regulator [unclassified Paludibacterium]|uniref:TetR/AcrR family transcriptional regulator n=1 Tax=unclassified Paludibacterium TaxID=2618429 RepID=UPI001C051E7C|nr:TetR/AcrR family transcriptional regulator [Paludibacterium sp. B53371]BEV71628.1 efflux system transcriptional repressor MexL [Paludibacterium sp. THUN1379]